MKSAIALLACACGASIASAAPMQVAGSSSNIADLLRGTGSGIGGGIGQNVGQSTAGFGQDVQGLQGGVGSMGGARGILGGQNIGQNIGQGQSLGVSGGGADMCTVKQIIDFARSIRQLEEIISQQLASISSVLASTQGQQQQQQGVQIPQPQGQFQQGGQQGSQLVDQLMSSGIFQQLQTTNRDLSSSCSSLSAPACMRSTPSPATTAVVQAIAELKQQVAQQSQAISAALTNVGERTLLVEKVEKIRELTTRARAALQAAACATNEMYESQTSSILGSSGLVSGGACSNIGATASTSDVSSQVAGILGALGTVGSGVSQQGSLQGNLGNLGNLGGLGGQLGGYGASIGGGEYGNRYYAGQQQLGQLGQLGQFGGMGGYGANLGYGANIGSLGAGYGNQLRGLGGLGGFGGQQLGNQFGAGYGANVGGMGGLGGLGGLGGYGANVGGFGGNVAGNVAGFGGANACGGVASFC